MFLPVLWLPFSSLPPPKERRSDTVKCFSRPSFHRCLFTIDWAVIRSCWELLVSISGCCFLGAPMKGPLSWLYNWLSDGKVCGLVALCSCYLFACPKFAAYSCFTLFSLVCAAVVFEVQPTPSLSAVRQGIKIITALNRNHLKNLGNVMRVTSIIEKLQCVIICLCEVVLTGSSVSLSRNRSSCQAQLKYFPSGWQIKSDCLSNSSEIMMPDGFTSATQTSASTVVPHEAFLLCCFMNFSPARITLN